MVWLLVLVALSCHRGNSAVFDRVDLIELNRVCDRNGKVTLEQLIYWDWSDEHCRYDVVDWRMFDVDSQVPRMTHPRRVYTSFWYDRKCRLFRRVEAPAFQKTWTTYDPEIRARKKLPESKRRFLRRPNKCRY